MNLFDSYFLCLDIGTSCVRGIAHRVQMGEITNTAFSSCDTFDRVFGIKSVVDEIEHKIGHSFDSAYITGNLGDSIFEVSPQETTWDCEHKITQSDVKYQLSQIKHPENYYPIHIIPYSYQTSDTNISTQPVGCISRCLKTKFCSIFYNKDNLTKITNLLHQSHIQSNGMFDPQFLHNEYLRKINESCLFLDFGSEYTSVSLWTNRGPVLHKKIPHGISEIRNKISQDFNINLESANNVIYNVCSLIPKPNDDFTPLQINTYFRRSDANDIVVPFMTDIILKIKNLTTKAFDVYQPTKIIISGGGSKIDGVSDFIETTFGIRTEKTEYNTTVIALSKYLWNLESKNRKSYLARREKNQERINKIKQIFTRKTKNKKTSTIPIMPSTMCFNMRSKNTYIKFANANISALHIDMMDGLYVPRMEGNPQQLKMIRENTNAHLHVHLMTQNVSSWAANCIMSGANTIIIPVTTPKIQSIIQQIHSTGTRVGVALNPDTSVQTLKHILRDVDEVMLMAVNPGASGQEFNSNVLHKISILYATRKKNKLNFLISVDGGINKDTAQLCWNAGADLLVSGSFLANAPDFAIAIQELLKK
ncbi:MAG: ribulose-phosphate 3-epimerase [Alphaproteobacteria bacterium]